MLTITREQENTFPAFMNHKAARAWFKGKYGNRFVMRNTDWMNGEKVYYYHLVKDRDTYLKYFDRIKTGEIIEDVPELLESYQSIEISEEGRVHVIY